MSGHDVAVAPAAGRGGIWLRHRAARRSGLPHDARLPPGNVSLRHRHAGPKVAQSASSASRNTWNASCASSPRSCARSWRGWARAPSNSSWAAPTCSRSRRARPSTFPRCSVSPATPAAARAAPTICIWKTAPTSAAGARSPPPDRAFGATLAGRRGYRGPTVAAGRHSGAFLRQGQKITLHGEANDYLGKGLFRRHAGGVPARGRALERRRRASSATSPSTARPAAKPISPARRASASACAIPER